MISILAKLLVDKVLRVSNEVGATLKIVGDYSYDIYLIHNPFVVTVVTIVYSRFFKLAEVCSLIIATALVIIIPMLQSEWIIRKNNVLYVEMFVQWK